MNQPTPPRRQHHGGGLVPTRRQILTLGAATATALGLSRLGAAQAATPGPHTDGGRVTGPVSAEAVPDSPLARAGSGRSVTKVSSSAPTEVTRCPVR